MELQYTNDNAIIVYTAEDLQGTPNAFTKYYRAPSLILNTTVLHQLPLNQPLIPPIIKVANTPFENVEHFPYLDNLVSFKVDIDVEINHRLNCEKSVWRLRPKSADKTTCL